jgi:WD40 repeat protein
MDEPHKTDSSDEVATDSPNGALIPSIDSAALLDVGWKPIPETMAAATRGWERFIENHYSLHSVSITIKSDSLEAAALQTIEGHGNSVNAVAFSQDGKQLVSGYETRQRERHCRRSRAIDGNVRWTDVEMTGRLSENVSSWGSQSSSFIWRLVTNTIQPQRLAFVVTHQCQICKPM